MVIKNVKDAWMSVIFMRALDFIYNHEIRHMDVNTAFLNG